MKLTEFKGIVKALPINIYKNSLTGCTNNGVSDRNKELLIIGAYNSETKNFIPFTDGFIDINFNSEEDMNKDNLCVLVLRKLWNEPHNYIASLKDILNGKWLMFGGNFGWTSDSRFRKQFSEHPLAIHDRIEE